MSTKFSEDIVAIGDLKINPGKIIKRASINRRPLLLTSRGRGIAVVQSVDDYEHNEEERAFLQAIVKGLVDIEEGREVSLKEAKKRLGLK
ncbi:MAG TPA: type II toxin-antitoxin system Phd/YefM family antitoxin [Dissulfurispiraceae bacterium]|nr:type II toxin-antitoxin system Phd/YefM family antitoxin [Dissulfurispiraceae bacterium]